MFNTTEVSWSQIPEDASQRNLEVPGPEQDTRNPTVDFLAALLGYSVASVIWKNKTVDFENERFVLITAILF